jgi:DNA-3-methyladenine glycosylase II
MPSPAAPPNRAPSNGEIPDHSVLKPLRRLAKADADLGRAWRLVGALPDRRRPPGFATLMNVVVSQQLSVASANAIFGRLQAAAQPFTPERFLALRRPRLQACGLSRPKIDYCRAVARALADGALDLDRVAALPDAEAVAEMVQVRGIGRWTAEIYLLFALGRPDVWPAQDLALQVALQRLKRLPDRPGMRDMDALAEPWRPHRGVAARLLWSYYRVSRERQIL